MAPSANSKLYLQISVGNTLFVEIVNSKYNLIEYQFCTRFGQSTFSYSV